MAKKLAAKEVIETPEAFLTRIRREVDIACRGDHYGSHELEMAMDGHKGATEEMWREIATGRANIVEMHIWVEWVARRIVEKVFDATGGDREREALKAIGLADKLHSDWRFHEDIRIYDSLAAPRAPVLAGGADRRGSAGAGDGPGMNRRELAQYLLARGHRPGQSEEAVMQAISYARRVHLAEDEADRDRAKRESMKK